MIGLKNYKGDRDLENNEMHLTKESSLLIQELQNFIHINEGDCPWDSRHGLSRSILFSYNDEAIKTEIRNKILEFYGDRVNDVYNMSIYRENNSINFTGKLNTIYGSLEIGGVR